MALSSTVFLTSSCIPQIRSRPLSVPKPNSVSQTTSLMLPPPQATHRLFHYQPLKHNRTLFGTVKALKKDEKSFKNVEIFSEEHLHGSLVHDIVELSQKYIRDKGSFSVALSDTPSVKFLRKLSEPPYIDTIEWSKWRFFWVEEEVFVPGDQLKKRLVPNDQLVAKINHKLAYDEFLTTVSRAAGSLNVYTIDYDLSDENEAAERYEKKLEIWVSKNEIAKSKQSQLPKFDLMFLGMEADGRVGSLMPDHPVLDENEKWVASVKDKDVMRVTLTLPVINSSSNIAMVVAGSANADAVYSAFKDDNYPQAPSRKLPAKLISPDEGDLVWYLDRAAASKLFKEEVRIDDKRS
ncbi:probable 6-phosphogluconolactonase 2 [Prosopis cineraria]|uniref:probable 6-phosphogluconolactonase 2 n=1 Tax=Prosopis cineraria TaxID=364024 RepID=UPI00240FF20A|nr:probable 6-phosphogluconolactonase 2 [Prosopis cineraria]XP_054797819.1 probable 6-phosphogluconolactonase 2 [Prosopis cineraria]